MKSTDSSSKTTLHSFSTMTTFFKNNIKNTLRTFEAQKGENFKNIEPRSKRTGSDKKKRVYIYIYIYIYISKGSRKDKFAYYFKI